ncbi:MAG: DegT/DnrJ/EryC1/StrS aminotransferase family protein [Methanobrevibacter sp.]|jgi:dTDP-4-amino-4,6-dideoxygalactose transaminase|uniref:DegT/DnrJ/EryC1/StrS family aminotransferase n=1 Tax=Methanobrevibacter sp. TaxID=66852 RepID=UPI0025D986C1|nr:DegT/DnrJ/EryC1/StrS family aminotransferase [Methanobrevibacter sp.]MBE6497560.1 DegT/DnrJ/EryC1/StrS aminotransferase family protein [Methanobrevibacter sp.]
MFKFKTPSKKTLETMSEIAKGNVNENMEAKAIDKIKSLTGHENVKITSSGNNSIFIALCAIEGDLIIPDQGGWHGFKQIAKFLGKNIITLKTDLGLISTEYLEELDVKENSALIYTSFAGYCAEQDTKSISKYCKNNNITTIEDASAGIGDSEKRLGNGKYADIIIASTGSPKIINVGSGGFITSNDEDIFRKTSLPQKLSKTSQIVCGGICCELDNVGEKLELTVNATKHLKNNIETTLHANKRGVNVIIPHDNAKEISWNLKKLLPIDKSGFITTCPNYNRVKQKAIAVEIKNLAYECLENENLEKIIEEINNQL